MPFIGVCGCESLKPPLHPVPTQNFNSSAEGVRPSELLHVAGIKPAMARMSSKMVATVIGPEDLEMMPAAVQGCANAELFEGLLMLQHRGQDSAGMVTYDRHRFCEHKDNGLVNDVFGPKTMKKLRGQSLRLSPSLHCGAGAVGL